MADGQEASAAPPGRDVMDACKDRHLLPGPRERGRRQNGIMYPGNWRLSPSTESWGVSASPCVESGACSGEESWGTLEQDAQNDPGAQCPLLEAEMLWSHRLART